MRTVRKYPVNEHVNEFFIEIPKGAEILTLQVQSDQPMIWALVDTEETMVQRKFIIVGTGQPFKDSLLTRYTGTYQQGRFVWHVFEVVAW